MERMMDVVMGKKSVKFFFWIYMSPGSLPNHESLPPKVKMRPSAISMTPNIISDLPNVIIFVR
jgi:hypothetical protein